MWCRGIFSIWISNLIERYTRRNTTCLMLVFVPFTWTCWALNYLAVVGILCVAHSGNGTEVELPQITCGGKLSNFEFSTYCPPRTGLARRPVPIRYLEKGRIWWASNCYSTGDRLALSWSNSYLSNWKTCYRWRRNMHLTNWLHMAYQVIPISQ